MDFSLPSPHHILGSERLEFLEVFKKSCIHTMLEMLHTSQSGHPGGSLSTLDFLATLYVFRITHTHEKIVISNGHISPGVYSVLAECGAIPHDELIRTYRQLGSPYEGHVTRHIPGIHFGTGPLGVGVSVAAGMALAEKKKKTEKRVFMTLGDGEAQEGQVHEMMLFASKYKLNNLTAFVDYNRVQLTASLKETMPIDIAEIFRAGKWNVLEIDGHDPEKIWEVLAQSEKSEVPTLIVGRTIMGHGVSCMEDDGRKFIPTWHGQSPSKEVLEKEMKHFNLTIEEQMMLQKFREDRNFKPTENHVPQGLTPLMINMGTPIEYTEESVACRKAYGNALLDLAKQNPTILASTADLGGSVKTVFVQKELPNQHIEYGISEQNMVSASGGISLSGFIPFCSTFGAFMSSRPKDQARVNDINHTNVKMVATHCGLSVGEDGPTHQAIDDMGSFEGFFHTYVCEPADANHCDRIIRYVANHYGNFYVRMGRHKLPVLRKPDGSLFYDQNYEFYHGRTDVYRPGKLATLVVAGSVTAEALKAVEMSGMDIEIVIASSPKSFDHTLEESLRKTGKLITVEDHNPYSGYGCGVPRFAAEKGVALSFFKSLAVREYQLSGKPSELYAAARVDALAILEIIQSLN